MYAIRFGNMRNADHFKSFYRENGQRHILATDMQPRTFDTMEEAEETLGKIKTIEARRPRYGHGLHAPRIIELR